MEHLIIPKDYHSELNLHDTQIAIKTVKDFFQNLLALRLNLSRVSAPLFVDPLSGLNDNLNGIERPVTFDIKEQNGKEAEVVQSLAKWKRYALKKYGFDYGEGLYTDMNAIRRDEDTDNIHSIFVDQWDWEKIIHKEDRDIETLKESARIMLQKTGHEEISLSSLSSSDYAELEELINYLIDICKKKKINISLPSLRIDAFSLDIMQKVQDIKKSSLTFAPEAGTQRLRNVINKGLTVENIMDGSRQAFEGGWNKVKFYFMLGLPTETEEDIRGIPELADQVAMLYYDTVPKEKRNGKCQITISTSFFVPKPFTPFQWAKMYDPSEYLGRAKIVNDHVKEMHNRKSIRYNWYEAYISVLEGILARGDRKISDAILKVYENGGYFDAWSEYFDYDRWLDAFKECGIDPDFYTKRERSLDEIFPWDFIDIGVSKDFMKREWKNALAESVTPNCRMRCSACGAKQFGGGVCYEN